jgi:serine/threonine protein kinase
MENASVDALDEVVTPSMPLSMPEGVGFQGKDSQEEVHHNDQRGDESSGYERKSGTATPHEVDQQHATRARSLSYGRPTLVTSFGNFPHPGALLGPFFSLGRLGKGTFCSIHKCISLMPEEPRLVAAKVELANFMNSGVLEGEATMLQHLHTELPPRTVPSYLGHFRSDEASAIVMEYLPGNDMHHLREKSGRRRLALEDAVYLAADVMLPLLQSMHSVGVVHRDVKPSNCVRYDEKHFCMVDFGLSKSILVPCDSQYADSKHVWKSKKDNGEDQQQYCMRLEREKADFRGTSMYASVRVHQLKDYARRDDMWSLLYVFCDLVSGGLPWMSFAANRDRDACQEMKERIHGLDGNGDQTEKLLMGDEYHVAKYKFDMAKKKGDEELPPVPEPLKMSKDPEKIELLRTAFDHVAKLSFSDEPDYAIIQECMHGFLDSPIDEADSLPALDWQLVSSQSPSSEPTNGDKTHAHSAAWKQGIPSWHIEGAQPAFLEDEALWEEAEAEHAETRSLPPVSKLSGDAADMARLPLELQFRVAQIVYNMNHSSSIPGQIALNCWMQCALPLVYGTWDTKAYEPGGHRTDSDGYRREVYLKLLDKCLKCASNFGYFRDRVCLYEAGADAGPPATKRRKITADGPGASAGGEITMISRVLHGLGAAKQNESRKSSAPPPALSFGSGMET